MKRHKGNLFGVAIALLFAMTPIPAFAVLYDIVEVQSGSSGFGASLFHKATATNAMGGATLANIPSGIGSFGTYDSDTGEFHAVLPVSVNGPTFKLDSTGSNDPTFGGPNGELVANSTLVVTLNAPGLNGVTTDTLGFFNGYVCCGLSEEDPNTFRLDGGNMIMTLWGANGFNVAATAIGDAYSNSSLGIDLRLRLVPVPIPAALPMFLGALGLIGLLSRRRRKVGVSPAPA